MYNEDTILDNQVNNSEETVVNNNLDNEETVVESPNQNEEVDINDESDLTENDKSNKGKRFAAVAAGAATAATATAAGVYYMNGKGEDIETEDITTEPTAESTVSGSTHPNPHPHPQPTPEPEPQPTPEPEPEPTPEPEPQPTPEPDVVVVEPEVEILGVEVVHTDNGDMTLGGMVVNGEEYVLVDVDNDNIFDVAWHDDNHDQQIQETELIDITSDNISVNDFAQAANQNNGDYTDPNENLITENDIDPMGPGEIDYMDTSDTSGLV